MTINLPLDNIKQPVYKFQHRSNWGDSWVDLPRPQTFPMIAGFYLEEFDRCVMPDVGKCTFRYDAGKFENQVFGVDPTTGADAADIDLVGEYIRILMAPAPASSSDAPSWSTVWVGVCEYQEDQAAPGAGYLFASRKYYCTDLLYACLHRWPIRKHGYCNTDSTGKTTYYPLADGHPGFNTRAIDGRILGNNSGKTMADAIASSDVNSDQLPWSDDKFPPDYNTLPLHCLTGVSGLAYSDLDAVREILGITKPNGAPWFSVGLGNGDGNFLSLPAFGWSVDIGMTAWDFISKVFDRRRGRGCAYLAWTESNGNITPRIQVDPQTISDITWTDPTNGTTKSTYGASNAGTTVAVDLVGDHRNLSESFRLGDRYLHTYDSVETLGEPIQLLANLTLSSKSLVKCWTQTDEDSFKAKTQNQRIVFRFDKVYQCYGLNPSWDGTSDDGHKSAQQPVIYKCSNEGAIIAATVGNKNTAPDVIRLMSDLPLFSDYNYNASPPARYDGATVDIIPPDRRSLMLLYDYNDGYFARGDSFLNGVTARLLGQWRLELTVGSDIANGTRQLGPTEFGGGGLDVNNLTLVVGLELPHRVRFLTRNGTVTKNQRAVRKQMIVVPGLHLWLAAPNAIWDLDNTQQFAGGNRLKPFRNAGGDKGILRDDRSRLAAIHAIASQWYLEKDRRTATWALRACGFTNSDPSLPIPDGTRANPPQFTTADPSTGATASVKYPTLGSVVTTISQGGYSYPIKTPITRMHYSHTAGNGITTWITDWSDADFSQ